MAGYTRQSVADIIANAIIKAAPVNAEFNTIRDAFAQATGHAHDGTSAEGAYVPLISDTNAFNKVVVDSVNNRISFYNDVSSVAVEQIRIEDGVFVPVTDNDVDLGAVGAEFKDLYIDGIGYIDTLAVHENATVAGTLDVTGLSTLATVDINGGNIDGTVIGAASAAAGGFTTVTTSGQAALNSVNIDGGTVDGTTIGATTPAAGTFTTLTATTGVTGDVTGNVTGNLTGNSTGVHTGAVTGDVTGNITAAAGSSSFNNVTINGSLDMNSVSSATITGLTEPVLGSDAATKTYVDTSVSDLVAAAPGTLDTLNELAAALGDDPAFATTVTASIATKLPLAGGTMSGAIAMGTSKITGMGDPTANQDAATKVYTDTQDALKVTKAGDTMSGALAMGSNQITGLAAPTLGGDATNKTYVDGILGSATAASASAAAAAVSESNAATSETNAATSESNAATSESNAAASYDAFDDRYLGDKAVAPTLDNDGGALLTGALYFDTVTETMKVYTGSGWVSAGSSVNGTTNRQSYVATGGQTSFAAVYDAGYVDVWLNGVKLQVVVDFDGTSGTAIVLTTGATAGDIVDIIGYGTFELADHYTKIESDALYYSQSAVDSTIAGLDATYVDQTSATGSANVPVGTTAQRDGVPASGMLRYNTTLGTFEGYTTAWADLVSNPDALLGANNLSDLANAATALVNLGVTSTAAELNILDGVTASTAEINHLVGVTSPIQTQIDNATPFTPTTVTGTTPSLDLGSFNFFDNGTLTGDTTVTFASVPTEARWSYSFIADLVTGYELDSASFVQSFSVAAQDLGPFGVFFKPDGTKMYFAGNSGDSVYEYDLSTPWDVSTAVFLQSFSIAAQDTSCRGLVLKPDGTKMYVVGNTGDDINEYDLSTPWNVSTAVFLQSLSVSAQDLNPWGLFFKPDGTKMYITGISGQDVNEYNLSTPWDVSTAVFVQSFSVATQDTSPSDVFFKPDGTKMYVTGAGTGDSVYEYDLSVPWDVSTAVFFSQLFSVAAQDTNPYGLFFKPDGTKMYVTGGVGSDVNEYDTFSGTALTLPASVQNPPTLDGEVGAKVTYEFYTLDGGTNVYLINEEVL